MGIRYFFLCVRPTNIYYQLQFHLTFVPVIHGVLTYCCIRPQVVVVVFIVVVFGLILSTEMQPYSYSSDSKVLQVTFYRCCVNGSVR